MNKKRIGMIAGYGRGKTLSSVLKEETEKLSDKQCLDEVRGYTEKYTEILGGIELSNLIYQPKLEYKDLVNDFQERHNRKYYYRQYSKNNKWRKQREKMERDKRK